MVLHSSSDVYEHHKNIARDSFLRLNRLLAEHELPHFLSDFAKLSSLSRRLNMPPGKVAVFCNPSTYTVLFVSYTVRDFSCTFSRLLTFFLTLSILY